MVLIKWRKQRRNAFENTEIDFEDSVELVYLKLCATSDKKRKRRTFEWDFRTSCDGVKGRKNI